MTAERWNKIKALFSSAQDVAVDERDNFLSRACGGDEELKIEVEKLLSSDRDDDAFLQDSAVAQVASIFDSDRTAGLDFAVSDEVAPRFEAGAMVNERYKIERLLGRGGMGEVYLAGDTRINRNVAIKVLHSDLVSSKESLRRFALEAQTVSALNHPHIMTIHEFDTTKDGTLFFVAEYVDGQILNRLIAAGLDLRKALDIAIQTASALSAAHDAGITHRDIKPENIMVRQDGYVKVLDFGLAKLTQKEAPSTNAGSEDPTVALSWTRPGAVMGTAAYMSPEQARGLRVDARTDIWSLAAVTYEMLTGSRPFLGDTPADVIVSVLSGEPPKMSSYVIGVPAELERVVAKALSKSVKERHQTCDELKADLENIRKRVEFDETLSRSAGDAAPGIRTGGEEEILATVKNAAPTAAADGAATTKGEPHASSEAPKSSSLLGFRAVAGKLRGHKIVYSVVAAVLAALISLAAYLSFVTPRASAQINSIAVLPFENPGENPDLVYAADGISESLIDRFSQMPQLKVISRNSSFKFRGTKIDVRDVASQLGVRAIVTGSVTQAGDDLAVRFDIVDAVEDKHLAGGQYRRKTGDLLTIQAEIARAAADQLRMKLTDSQSKRLGENGTDNSEAYRYYLSGLVELNGPQDVRSRALEYFERAVTLDPNFAPAHAEIGWVYWSRANGSGDPDELMPKAKAATQRALEIDPNLAKAHVVQAGLNEYEFDWRSAESEYRRAIELSPNLDFARNNYAFFLSVMGRQAQALAELEEQRLRDPINRRLALLQQGIVLTQARRFDDALRAYQEAQAVEPVRDIPNFSLGYAYAGKGLYNEAAGYYRKSVASLGGEEKYSQPLVYLAATYAKIPEKRTEARAVLTRIEAMGHYTSPALLAAVYSALDDNDKAMELLEQAYIKRDLLLRFIGTGYEYDGLRDDPRFKGLLRRMGIPEHNYETMP